MCLFLIFLGTTRQATKIIYFVCVKRLMEILLANTVIN